MIIFCTPLLIIALLIAFAISRCGDAQSCDDMCNPGAVLRFKKATSVEPSLCECKP